MPQPPQALECLEVELKFPLVDPIAFGQQLLKLGAGAQAIEVHVDTYYAHPCRDFAVSGEALRIRRLNGVPHVTYKGPKQPGSVKIRRELEWSLAPGDPDGNLTEELWKQLGFRPVATVHKQRQPFTVESKTVTIDRVSEVGVFAEIEQVVAFANVETARNEILALALQLGLEHPEPRSYLQMRIGKSH